MFPHRGSGPPSPSKPVISRRKTWASSSAELVFCVVLIRIFVLFQLFPLVKVDQPFGLMIDLPKLEEIGDGRHLADAYNYFHNTVEMPTL